MAVDDGYVFPGFLTPVLTQLFFPKPPTTFLTCFCRGERRKYAGKKSRLNRGSNSQPLGHESDTLTTEPPGRGTSKVKYENYTCQQKPSNNPKKCTSYTWLNISFDRADEGQNRDTVIFLVTTLNPVPNDKF